MPAQILPAASLRKAKLLPAARALYREANYLIFIALWSIAQAICSVKSNFSLLSGRASQPAASSRGLGSPHRRHHVLGTGADAGGPARGHRLQARVEAH